MLLAQCAGNSRARKGACEGREARALPLTFVVLLGSSAPLSFLLSFPFLSRNLEFWGLENASSPALTLTM